jgi:hypothetical protein
MAKYNLKRIDLHVPQYDTDATITVDENYSSGQPHLVTTYKKVPPHGHKEVAVAIPADWTDQDLAELDLSSHGTEQRSKLAGMGDSRGRSRRILAISLLEG